MPLPDVDDQRAIADIRKLECATDNLVVFQRMSRGDVLSIKLYFCFTLSLDQTIAQVPS